MKIERIKKSLDAHGILHVLTIYGQVCCKWSDSGRCFCIIRDSYGSVYRKLKDLGVLSRKRYLSHRQG